MRPILYAATDAGPEHHHSDAGRGRKTRPNTAPRARHAPGTNAPGSVGLCLGQRGRRSPFRFRYPPPNFYLVRSPVAANLANLPPGVTATPESFFAEPPSHLPIEQAALRSVAYADVFDYPLLAAEVHRYLHGLSATPEVTAEALARCSAPGGTLACREGYYTLPGREGLVEVRRRRAALARNLWPTALKYGRLIAALPFVRMVAVTGSLAWDNIDGKADIDYLIVTEPDRLWVCRWLVRAVGRVARRDGVTLCPNYVVSKRALVLSERNLYAAYELARMTPIAGLGMHRRLRRANPWALAYLPNAVEVPRPPVSDTPHTQPWPGRALVGLARLGERTLRSPLGTMLERCEMRYRIRQLAKIEDAQRESSYGVDWYKAHTTGNRHHALAAFGERLRVLRASAP